jgi:hypothetical protein
MSWLTVLVFLISIDLFPPCAGLPAPLEHVYVSSINSMAALANLSEDNLSLHLVHQQDLHLLLFSSQNLYL